MNRLMRTLTSLANFKKAKHTSGQIATLLVLLLTVVLVFVMVTANIGQVAVDATTVANAADTAALLLGSQLATKAQMLSKALYDECDDYFECCETTGFLDMLLGVVFAVVAIVLCVGAWWAGGCGWGAVLMGMVGGMIGAAIQGTSIAQGAITGAAIGASLSLIATGVGSGLETLVGRGSVQGLQGLAIAGAKTILVPAAINTGTVALGALGLASSIYNAVASNQIVGTMFHQLGQDIAKLGERDQIREGVIFAALYRAIDDPTKHMDEHDVDADYDKDELVPRFAWWWHERMRKFESIRNKQIPEVQKFLRKMDEFRDDMATAYAGGPNIPVVCGEDGCPPPPSGSSWSSGPGCTPGATGSLERKDYKWSLTLEGGRLRRIILDNDDERIKDGAIVTLLRGLLAGGVYVKRDNTCNRKTDPTCLFWRPGPTAQEMNTWLSKPCKLSKPVSANNCPPRPKSYDEIDGLADGIRRMVFYMDTISPPGFDDWYTAQTGNMYCQASDGGTASLRLLYDKYSPESKVSASSNWETWRRRFYNKNNINDPTTYYSKLGEWIDFLNALKLRLIAVRKGLPDCLKGQFGRDSETGEKLTWCTSCFWYPCIPWDPQPCVDSCGECSLSALPCKIKKSPTMPIGGINVEVEEGVQVEAFVPAINAINGLITSMSDFRDAIPIWSDKMDEYLQELAAKDFENDFGGYPTVTYRWTDSRGYNSVVVTVGEFIIPNIDDESRDINWYSTDECVVLKDYTDTDEYGNDNCWVRVTKYPPSKNQSWEVPMGALGKFNPFNRGVTKKSYAEYNIDKVALKNK